MPLAPSHDRSRRRTFRRGAALLILAAAAALLAPIARLFGLAGGPLFAVERAASYAAAPLVDYLSSKRSLAEENRALRESVERLHAAALERDALAAERDALAAELAMPDRSSASVVAEIRLRPPQTTFDTLVLGAGRDDGVAEGDAVLAQGLPVGVVVEARDASSVATLFSAPGSRLAVTVGGHVAEALGQGAGRYSVELPSQLSPATGTPVLSVAHRGSPIGYVSTVVREEGGTTVAALVLLPIDLGAARYVTVQAEGER